MALRFACGVVLLLAFIGSRLSRASVWSLLMLLAALGILLFGALAYLELLLTYIWSLPEPWMSGEARRGVE